MAKLDFVIDSKGCFVCNSHVHDGKGYIKLEFKGKRIRAHRLVYEECFGEIPEGMIIRHKCDNPTCINPVHLETGTPKDNVNDMVRRGRTASTLTEKQVLSIRFDTRSTVEQLANYHNISVSSVRNIISGRRWKHIRGVNFEMEHSCPLFEMNTNLEPDSRINCGNCVNYTTVDLRTSPEKACKRESELLEVLHSV
jgi:hypothetical protein